MARLLPGCARPLQEEDEAMGAAGVPPPRLYEREPYLLEQPAGTLPPGVANLGFFARCVLVAAPMSPVVAEELVARIRAVPCQHCYVHLQHAGGAVADVAAADSAFALRGLEWSVVLTGCWPKSDADGLLRGRCETWAREAAAALLRLPSALGTYATDLGPGAADGALAGRAYGGNQAELVRLKRAWDPRGLFRCGFPLPVGDEDGDGGPAAAAAAS